MESRSSRRPRVRRLAAGALAGAMGGAIIAGVAQLLISHRRIPPIQPKLLIAIVPVSILLGAAFVCLPQKGSSCRPFAMVILSRAVLYGIAGAAAVWASLVFFDSVLVFIAVPAMALVLGVALLVKIYRRHRRRSSQGSPGDPCAE
jgi:hypothetical protein